MSLLRENITQLDTLYTNIRSFASTDTNGCYVRAHTMSGGNTEEQAALKKEIPKKESAIQSLRGRVSGADSFISKAGRYTDIVYVGNVDGTQSQQESTADANREEKSQKSHYRICVFVI